LKSLVQRFVAKKEGAVEVSLGMNPGKEVINMGGMRLPRCLDAARHTSMHLP